MSSRLQGFALFDGLSPEELSAIDRYVVQREYKKGKTIFHEGEKTTHLYMVDSGKVKLVKHTPQGKDVIVDIGATKDTLSLEPIFDGEGYPTSAVAVEPTNVLLLDRRQLLKFVEQFPIILKNSVRIVSSRSRDLYRHIKELSVGKVDSRIANLILRLGEKIGRDDQDKVKIDIHLSRQDIADFTGTTVETAIRTMSRFAKTGLVKTTKNWIVIENREELEQVAEI